VLSVVNNYLIPETFRTLPEDVGNIFGVTVDFDMSQISFGIYGFILVIMMIMRPQGLLPERRREAEMTHSDEHAEESVFVARA
jgi:branched-chain amino acid transport system permease protein